MPVGSEARHSASPHAWPWHPVVLKADPLGDTPLPPCPRHLTVCLPLPIKVKNNDPSFSCLIQAGSGMGPGCRSSTQLHGILSGPLAEGSCPGDGPLRPCKVESGTHRKRIVSPWISGGDASSPPPCVQNPDSLWRLVVHSACEGRCVLRTRKQHRSLAGSLTARFPVISSSFQPVSCPVAA